jgi:hypothetical protein
MLAGNIVVGEVYIAQPTKFFRDYGDIAPRSKWVVTCIHGDKVSVTHYSGNGSGLSRFTIAKTSFVTNFLSDPEHVDNLSNVYDTDKHYYPDFKVPEHLICSFKGKG